MIPTNDEQPEPINVSQMAYIERLIEGYRGDINFNLTHFHQWTFDEANEFIDILKANQKDPVTEKGQYSATQLNEHFKKFL